MMQTYSPINIDRIKGQNARLLEYLLTGHRIHCFHTAKRQLRIGYINSRISDLVNKNKIPVESHYAEVQDMDGRYVTVKVYYLSEEVIEQIKSTYGKNTQVAV